MTRSPRIFNGSGQRDWRWGLRHSRMLCLIWSARPEYAQIQRTKLAYAMQLGKPIRILVCGADCLPEDLCAGYADVQVARVAQADDAGPQVQRWLAALEAREDTP
jgi:hypothetical protein